MIDGKMLSQLEQANKIPAGSLHMLEMGDGSGTKVVTLETLVEETGKALMVGNLKELETEEKTSLVAAINEAKKSGGSGTSVDILDSKEEIEANTETEKVAGALAMKEMFTVLNDNLANGQISFDVINGEPYVKVGADTPRPFKGNPTIRTFSASASKKTYSVNIDIKSINNYQRLSADNMVAGLSNASANGGTVSCSIDSINYDPNTGIVTVNLGWGGISVSSSTMTCGIRLSVIY